MRKVFDPVRVLRTSTIPLLRSKALHVLVHGGSVPPEFESAKVAYVRARAEDEALARNKQRARAERALAARKAEEAADARYLAAEAQATEDMKSVTQHIELLSSMALGQCNPRLADLLDAIDKLRELKVIHAA